MNGSRKELNSFWEYLKVYMRITKLRDVNYNYYSKIEDHSFDNYSIEQFLIVCKLKRMEELGTVNRDVAKTLHEILDMKIDVDKKIGEESIKALYSHSNVSDRLAELHKKSEELSECLKKHNLSIDEFDFNYVIDLMINGENKSKTEKDITVRTKKID